MRLAVFIGAVALMFLGTGILTGTVGTLVLTHHDYVSDTDTMTYNICINAAGLYCMPISENAKNFLEQKLSMPTMSIGNNPLAPERGNYYY